MNDMSARIKEVDHQLEAIRARRRTMVEREQIGPSASGPLRRTWSQPLHVVVESKRRMLKAQEWHVEYVRSRVMAIQRLYVLQTRMCLFGC